MLHVRGEYLYYKLQLIYYVFTVSHADHLTMNNFRDIEKQLWGIRYKWFKIGTQLNFKPDVLKSIEGKYKSEDDRYLPELIEMWLKRTEPKPTWAALVAALREIGEEGLADDIITKYIPTSHIFGPQT